MAAPTMPTNGPVIRALRRAYGIPQRALAADVEISESYLSRIETGYQNASPPVLRRLADRLHVPLDAIVRIETKQPAQVA